MGLKLRGYEKFWNPIFGAGMCASITVIVIYFASIVTGGYITAPTPEVITGAIGGFVATLFAAASAFIATTSAPTAENPNSNQIGVPQPTVADAADQPVLRPARISEHGVDVTI